MYTCFTLPMNLQNLISMHYCRCALHYFTNELTELDYYALLQTYTYITLPMNLQNLISMHYCIWTSTLLYQWTYIPWLLCIIADVHVHYFTNDLTKREYYALLQMYTYIILLYQWTYRTWLVCIIVDVQVHYFTNELTELDNYALL